MQKTKGNNEGKPQKTNDGYPENVVHFYRLRDTPSIIDDWADWMKEEVAHESQSLFSKTMDRNCG